MRLRNIDRFQVRKVLGEGGQGTVYLAHDPKLNRDVAIKTLRAGKDEEAQSLLQEARAVSNLRHPCIVPVFEAGQIGDMHYLVFEFVTGETLQSLIERKGALPVDDARRIAGQVLDALAHAHQNGVLHRDIKPANIMLGSDGQPRIMDFGAASRNHLNWLNGANVAVDDDFIGTPAYMAPEYIEKRVFSAKTDVYAAGLVFFEMFTGRRVFRSEGGNLDMLFRRIVFDPVILPPAGGLDEKLMSCLLRAIARDPMQRFDSVLEMKEALLGGPREAEDGQGEGGTLEFLLRRMRLKKEFPALSESVTTVNNIIFSETGSIAALTNAVLKDFSLTGKIIKLANSAYYNPGRRLDISTISAAVYRLGFDTIRNIVLGLLLFDQIKDRGQKHELMGECVKAVLGGAIAKEICVSQGYNNPEETFICSMMHNLGRMLSLYYFPEETQEIRTVVDLGKLDENRAARQVLGATYTELGQGVARNWGFPDKIVDSMDKRPPPNPGRGTIGGEERLRLIACMSAELSETIVSGDPERRREQGAAVLERYKGHFKLSGSALDQVLARSLDKVEDYAKAVGWNLESGMAKRLAVPAPSSDADATLRPETDTADLEKTMHLTSRVEAALAVPAETVPLRPRGDVLSGGIQDITNALVDGRSLSDILRIVIETIYTGIGFEHAIFALRDQKQGMMVGRFGLGPGIEPLVGKFRFPIAFAPDAFHIALQKNIDILFNDTRDPKIAGSVPEWFRRTFDIGTFMLFPVVVKDKPVGMIYAGSTQANSIVLQEAELKLLRTLRNQAVLAVRQAG